MRTNGHATRWLGLVLACGLIACGTSVEAKKPPKPPPEPPPPEGPAYWIVAVEGTFSPASISDAGVLVGDAIYEYAGGAFRSPAVLPHQVIGNEVQYPANNLRWLPDVDGLQKFGDCLAMNGSDVAVGYMNDPEILRAILWLADGTPVDLGVDPGGISSSAHDINDAGLVLVGVGPENHPEEIGGIVIPLDGEPDTWFTDLDADGMNDLFFPTDAGHNLRPLVINEFDQVLSAQVAGGDHVAGYLVTPDFSDPDGDGNPWFADTAPADGFNDLLVLLEPPEPGAVVVVADLNNLGQVAGNSGGHVVRWDFDEDGVLTVVTDLGSLGSKVEMTAAGISDSGRIVGTSKTRTGRRIKTGPSWLIENDVIYELVPLIVNADGWSDLSADGINRDGWIHGDGWFDVAERWTRFVAIPID